MDIHNYKGGAMRTIEEIKHAFQPVGKNLDQGQSHRILKVQAALQLAAEEILDLVPECADRTHAMRQVLDAKFWCTQAISHFKVQLAAPVTPEGKKAVSTAEKTTTDETAGLTPANKDH